MRTTVTLDADTEAAIRRRMRDDGASFKVVLNDAIRRGLRVDEDESASARFATRVESLGRPSVNLDRALQLAAELDDDELLGRWAAGS